MKFTTAIGNLYSLHIYEWKLYRYTKISIAFAFICLMLISHEMHSQPTFNADDIQVFTENYRIHPGNTTQTEVFITVSPIDDDLLFSSCNTLTFIPLFISEGIYVSKDGGSIWNGSDSCKGEPINFHGGDPGIAIDKDGRFIITRLSNSFPGLFSHFSYDQGITWSSQLTISLIDSERASVITDAINTSDFYGRTYASWVSKSQPPYPIVISFVDSGNESWSESKPINSPEKRSAGGDISIGPEGEVIVCWAGVTDVSPFKEIYVGFAKSTEGGTNWSVNENAFSINGINGILSNKGNIRVNGLPGIDVDKTGGERNGWIYIVTGQIDHIPAGTDPDIILYRSINNGQTWSSGIRVNQDAINNGKTQYFPAIHIDKSGAVNIIYYDDRNTTIDSAGVFMSRSKDGGITWKDYEISDHNFKPTPIGALGQGYQGDNIDITSTSSALWPVWMDNSTGNYQIWTTPIDFKIIDNIDNEHTAIITIEQNFPNPFRTSSTITYNIVEYGFVSIKFFDIQGNELFSLVNCNNVPGEYKVLLSADNFKSKPGIYFYQINSNGFSETRKLILLN
jgi:hypothetical protein